MKNPSAREKVLKHVREFDRLWISLKSFLRMLNREVHIALEWPRKCRYWKLAKVAKLLSLYEMIAYHFDGCALGMVNQDNDPLKKPWDSGHKIMLELVGHCRSSNAHAIDVMHQAEV